MKRLRLTVWSTLVLMLSLAVAGEASFYPVSGRPAHPLDVQEPSQAPTQNNSAESLAEALQLTRTVIKLFSEKKYAEALPLAKRALELREAALGPDHELVQAARFNLAEVYTSLKKYGEAQPLVERLVETQERKAGPEDASVAKYLDDLAYGAFLRRDFSKSEATYKRALAIREKAFGPDHVEVASSLYALAELYRYRNQIDKAEPLYQRAALLRVKLLGHEHAAFLKARERYLCTVYERQYKYEDQARIFKDFAKKVLGLTHMSGGDPATGKVLNGIALSLPRPSYPPEARNAHAQGIVVVKVTVDEQGNVVNASDMCGGNPLLVESSLESARKARFTPTKLSGKPVKVTGEITYRFVAQ
jgi:TonB family protein